MSFLFVEAVSEGLLQIDLQLLDIVQHLDSDVPNHEEKLGVVGVHQIGPQRHRFDLRSDVLRLSSKLIDFVFAALAETLPHDEINEKFCLLV